MLILNTTERNELQDDLKVPYYAHFQVHPLTSCVLYKMFINVKKKHIIYLIIGAAPLLTYSLN